MDLIGHIEWNGLWNRVERLSVRLEGVESDKSGKPSSRPPHLDPMATGGRLSII